MVSDLTKLRISNYKGQLRIDIRKYYRDKVTGELKPTAKGINMTKEEFMKILEWDIPKVLEDKFQQ